MATPGVIVVVQPKTNIMALELISEEEDSALERPLDEGQNNTANWLENDLEKDSKQRRRRRGSPNFAIRFRAL